MFNTVVIVQSCSVCGPVSATVVTLAVKMANCLIRNEFSFL